jgi:type VI secretion system protein ImpF
MKRNPNEERFQVPLMYAFRDAFQKNDARKRIEERKAGERVLSERGSIRRRGADEKLLKQNLSLDLLALVNTIDLDSAIPLKGLDHARRSVINFGLRDIAWLTSEEAGVADIGRDLMEALLNHEPRLIRETLHVEKAEDFDDVHQRVRFNVSAEMACRPFDVPIEFVAEVDVGSGKVQLTRLPVTP